MCSKKFNNLFRSTSLRTVSTSRSAGATPKTGTLNSRDFHPSRNTSASSGSHILDTRHSHENVRQAADERATVGHTFVSSSSQHVIDTGDMQPAPGALQHLNCFELNFNFDSSHLLFMNQNANDNDDTSHDSYHLTESRDSLDGELDNDGEDKFASVNNEDIVGHLNVDQQCNDILSDAAQSRIGENQTSQIKFKSILSEEQDGVPTSNLKASQSCSFSLYSGHPTKYFHSSQPNISRDFVDNEALTNVINNKLSFVEDIVDNNITLDKNVCSGNSVTVNEFVSLDNTVTLEDNLALDNSVIFANDITLGNSVTLDNDVLLDNNVAFNNLNLNNDVSVDNNVTLKNSVSVDNQVSLVDNGAVDKCSILNEICAVNNIILITESVSIPCLPNEDFEEGKKELAIVEHLFDQVIESNEKQDYDNNYENNEKQDYDNNDKNNDRQGYDYNYENSAKQDYDNNYKNNYENSAKQDYDNNYKNNEKQDFDNYYESNGKKVHETSCEINDQLDYDNSCEINEQQDYDSNYGHNEVSQDSKALICSVDENFVREPLRSHDIIELSISCDSHCSNNENIKSENPDQDVNYVEKQNIRLEKQATIKSLEDGEDLNNEIPYILHRRHVSPASRDRTPLQKQKQQQLSRSSSTVPAVPSNDDFRLQLEKIKATLTCDKLPSPTRLTRSRSKSPASPRLHSTFDFVLLSKLPPRHSYSSQDDTVNCYRPSSECVFSEVNKVVNQISEESGQGISVTENNENFTLRKESTAKISRPNGEKFANKLMSEVTADSLPSNKEFINPVNRCNTILTLEPKIEYSSTCIEVFIKTNTENNSANEETCDLQTTPSIQELSAAFEYKHSTSEQQLIVPEIVIRAATPVLSDLIVPEIVIRAATPVHSGLIEEIMLCSKTDRDKGVAEEQMLEDQSFVLENDFPLPPEQWIGEMSSNIELSESNQLASSEYADYDCHPTDSVMIDDKFVADNNSSELSDYSSSYLKQIELTTSEEHGNKYDSVCDKTPSISLQALSELNLALATEVTSKYQDFLPNENIMPSSEMHISSFSDISPSDTDHSFSIADASDQHISEKDCNVLDDDVEPLAILEVHQSEYESNSDEEFDLSSEQSVSLVDNALTSVCIEDTTSLLPSDAINSSFFVKYAEKDSCLLNNIMGNDVALIVNNHNLCNSGNLDDIALQSCALINESANIEVLLSNNISGSLKLLPCDDNHSNSLLENNTANFSSDTHQLDDNSTNTPNETHQLNDYNITSVFCEPFHSADTYSDSISSENLQLNYSNYGHISSEMHLLDGDAAVNFPSETHQLDKNVTVHFSSKTGQLHENDVANISNETRQLDSNFSDNISCETHQLNDGNSTSVSCETYQLSDNNSDNVSNEALQPNDNVCGIISNDSHQLDVDSDACDLQLLKLNQIDEKMRRLRFAASKDSIRKYSSSENDVDSSDSSCADNESITDDVEPLEALESIESKHNSSDNSNSSDDD